MTQLRRRQPIGRLRWIQIDTQDPEPLAEFWSDVLGTEIDDRLGDPPQFINLVSVEPGAPHVSFQRVPEAKVGKNRLHFDLLVTDVEVACARVEAIGGRRFGGQDFHEHGFSWRVMVDPQGNEFCLIYGV
jgi:predicted enzyme related to lactoylglutathione lyase